MDVEDSTLGPEPVRVADLHGPVEPVHAPTSLSIWTRSAVLARLDADEGGDEAHILRGLE